MTAEKCWASGMTGSKTGQTHAWSLTLLKQCETYRIYVSSL